MHLNIKTSQNSIQNFSFSPRNSWVFHVYKKNMVLISLFKYIECYANHNHIFLLVSFLVQIIWCHTFRYAILSDLTAYFLIFFIWNCYDRDAMKCCFSNLIFSYAFKIPLLLIGGPLLIDIQKFKSFRYQF